MSLLRSAYRAGMTMKIAFFSVGPKISLIPMIQGWLKCFKIEISRNSRIASPKSSNTHEISLIATSSPVVFSVAL